MACFGAVFLVEVVDDSGIYRGNVSNLNTLIKRKKKKEKITHES